MSYPANRLSAAASIKAKGQSVTIAGTLTTNYDTATLTATASAAYNKTASAVILPLSAARKVGNSSVVEGDQTMLLAGLDTSGAVLPEPPVDATVTLADGATKLSLVACDPLTPDGTNILYDCVVRRIAA